MQNNINKTRLTIIVVVLLIVIFVPIILLHTKPKPKSTLKPGQAYCQNGDFPTSPSNCSNPYGPDTIAVTGYSNLIDAGMTTDNLSSMKYDVYLYGQYINQEIKSFDVEDMSKIIHLPPSQTPDGSSSWQFAARINDKETLTAKVVAQGINDARLYLYNGSALVFDSQSTPVPNGD